MVSEITQGHVLIDLIRSLGCDKCKIAEIGVWRSNTMKRVLRACSPIIVEYWAVDPWLPLEGGAGSHRERKLPARRWELQHMTACTLMAQWFPQIRVVRAKSEDACKLFKPEYFDLVFIDADHHYEETKLDIVRWLPTVKPGGILAGHDYGGKYEGVKQAVDELFPNELCTADAEVWYIKVSEHV